jgi:hypothetical protein
MLTNELHETLGTNDLAPLSVLVCLILSRVEIGTYGKRATDSGWLVIVAKWSSFC